MADVRVWYAFWETPWDSKVYWLLCDDEVQAALIATVMETRGYTNAGYKQRDKWHYI